jgi:hypothetical protein
MRIIRAGFAAPVVGLFGLLAAAPAHAQLSPGASMVNHRVPGTASAKPEPANIPPPALPGATSNYQPAERTATDLSPTDSLFDAINRGDITAARDAINRGADLNGHNILGMTPLDLSVDLSRNNITFLLLSLRGGSAAPSRVAGAAAQPGTKPSAAGTAHAAAKPVAKLAAVSPHPAPGVAAAPPVVARQYAGSSDPGTPVPQAGFLGFGGTVQ